MRTSKKKQHEWLSFIIATIVIFFTWQTCREKNLPHTKKIAIQKKTLQHREQHKEIKRSQYKDQHIEQTKWLRTLYQECEKHKEDLRACLVPTQEHIIWLQFHINTKGQVLLPLLKEQESKCLERLLTNFVSAPPLQLWGQQLRIGIQNNM